jgi:exopolysaccharide biosynthesis polyprenyl glycosylphosphotransferase
MEWFNKFKVFLLLLGDALALYASLFITLIVRYQSGFLNQLINYHFFPFTIVFAVWLAIFYIAGLYDLHRLRNNLDFSKILFLSLFINAAVAIFLFYLIPAFGITPRTNLFIFMIIFSAIEIFWRRAFNATAASGEAPNKVVVVDGNGSDSINSLYNHDRSWVTGLGYEIVAEEDAKDIIANPRKLKDIIASRKANLVVISRKLKSDPKLTRLLYELLNEGVEIRDLPNFYELVARKIPLADLEETWFIENLAAQQRFYDPLKRAWEFLMALAIGIALLPLELAIAVIIKLTSRGPVFIRQKRVGRLGKQFTLYKFRSMIALAPDGQAETKGPQWSAPADPRVTVFGKFLRYTHLDELPQLINIVRGNLSFVGPRPERPEFVKILEEKIPYYEIRHLIKPGVTGWAQIHHRADASEEDVIEKLQYDIYYLKNRSPILDVAIILKTIKTLFITPK